MTDIGEHIHEEPPWLQARVDQRLAEVKLQTGNAQFTGYTMVMLFLDDPGEDTNLDLWDQSCDICKRYAGDKLVLGHVARVVNGVNFVIAFGLCPQCNEKLS